MINNFESTVHEKLAYEIYALNKCEKLGKQYYEKYQKPLTYSQYLYLSTLSSSKQDINNLSTPKALAAQKDIEKNFSQKYHTTGLLEEDFFREDHNIEIEKLLRYIRIPSHRHAFLECSFVLHGTCTHIIDGNAFIQGPGCFTIISSLTPHELNASNDCLCLTIKVRSSHLPTMRIPNLPTFVYPLSLDCGHDAFICHAILELYRQQKNQKMYSSELVNDLFQVLLTYILQNYKDTMQILISGNNHDYQFVEIMNYIFENYRTITLESLAKHFHFNSSYLSDLFHKKAGQTFSHLLKDYKLRQAADLLITTSMKLANICEEVGYKDTAQFIREFKKNYQLTPIAYRKMMLQSTKDNLLH